MAFSSPLCYNRCIHKSKGQKERREKVVVIIAEKPSLARNICAGIGEMKKEKGFFVGQGYIVTWAFGHLFSLCDIETYNPAPEGARGWTLQNLPCFPSEFRFELRREGD